MLSKLTHAVQRRLLVQAPAVGLGAIRPCARDGWAGWRAASHPSRTLAQATLRGRRTAPAPAVTGATAATDPWRPGGPRWARHSGPIATRVCERRRRADRDNTRLLRRVKPVGGVATGAVDRDRGVMPAGRTRPRSLRGMVANHFDTVWYRVSRAHDLQPVGAPGDESTDDLLTAEA